MIDLISGEQFFYTLYGACPRCNATAIYGRKKKALKYRCQRCGLEFDEPILRRRANTDYIDGADITPHQIFCQQKYIDVMEQRERRAIEIAKNSTRPVCPECGRPNNYHRLHNHYFCSSCGAEFLEPLKPGLPAKRQQRQPHTARTTYRDDFGPLPKFLKVWVS